jgi:hypothetical protein
MDNFKVEICYSYCFKEVNYLNLKNLFSLYWVKIDRLAHLSSILIMIVHIFNRK